MVSSHIRERMAGDSTDTTTIYEHIMNHITWIRTDGKSLGTAMTHFNETGRTYLTTNTRGGIDGMSGDGLNDKGTAYGMIRCNIRERMAGDSTDTPTINEHIMNQIT